MKLNKNIVAFTGGGTAGHIYPGLAVADQLRQVSNNCVKIYWIGCSKGMDKKIVENSKDEFQQSSADFFYGIPSGKLRRYFSFKNFFDVFKIIGGFLASFYILLKIRPCVLFSKGGFVSVPPCFAAKLLKIPVFMHECDFTLGLANKINLHSAIKIFVSYEETKNYLKSFDQKKCIVSGNPVRPIFYNTNVQKGKDFLDLSHLSKENQNKPILLVLGGSSGAKQINNLVFENIEFLCKNFIVVHQTGLINGDENQTTKIQQEYENYKPFNFIYEQMSDVLSCSDIVLSRSGANSIWETAVLLKPMILIPLCGNGTRGDQVDNANFFAQKNASYVLVGKNATNENLIYSLKKMLIKENREKMVESLKQIVPKIPATKIIANSIMEFLN